MTRPNLQASTQLLEHFAIMSPSPSSMLVVRKPWRTREKMWSLLVLHPSLAPLVSSAFLYSSSTEVARVVRFVWAISALLFNSALGRSPDLFPDNLAIMAMGTIVRIFHLKTISAGCYAGQKQHDNSQIYHSFCFVKSNDLVA